MSSDTATAHTETITRSAQMHASASSSYAPAAPWMRWDGPIISEGWGSRSLTLLTLPRRGDPKPAKKPRKKDKRSARHTQRRK